MKYFQALISLLIFSQLMFSQKTDLPGKLPWVNGNLPQNSTNYNYKVTQGDGISLAEAQDKAVNDLFYQLAGDDGTLEYEGNLKTIQENVNNEINLKITYTDNTKLSKNIKVKFNKVDEYFETFTDIDGKKIYRTWQLYVVGDEAKSNIPKINYTNSYNFSEAGFKSLIVPGWGQFHKKQTTKGVLFMLAGIGSIGTFVHANNEYNYNMNRSQETSNLDLRKDYVKKANDFTSIKNISLAAAAVTWIWSTIDAVSTKGATKYAYQKPFKLNLASDGKSGLALNLKYTF
tara:strand:+ start:20 stop:883 length:864 start_codon:yes stop_codon:yes gene_type:complete